MMMESLFVNNTIIVITIVIVIFIIIAIIAIEILPRGPTRCASTFERMMMENLFNYVLEATLVDKVDENLRGQRCFSGKCGNRGD